MKFSTHNVLKGKVKKVASPDGALAEVLVELEGGSEVRSTVSKKRLEEMDLKAGKEVLVLIKAIDVMLAVE
ncbi:MAG: TOBE domain-containing protein [Syntrophorhabdus sp.]